jgi:hypothetical protein
MSNDEVQDLIEQLKNLQLQQTELLVRLERARRDEARAGVYDEEESGTQEFAIGDKVRIKNSTRFQADQGVITTIGPYNRTHKDGKQDTMCTKEPYTGKMSGNQNNMAGSPAPDNRADSHTSGRGRRTRGGRRSPTSGRGTEVDEEMEADHLLHKRFLATPAA